MNIISQDFSDTQTRFTKILESRLREGPLSRLDLRNVLCLPTVGEKDLANRIFGPAVNPTTDPPDDSLRADELIITKTKPFQ